MLVSPTKETTLQPKPLLHVLTGMTTTSENANVRKLPQKMHWWLRGSFFGTSGSGHTLSRVLYCSARTHKHTLRNILLRKH